MTRNTPKAFRSAHGTAARIGRLTASECPPTDELRPGLGTPTAAPERDAAGKFLPGNRAARRQLGRVHPASVLAKMQSKDPAWRSARRWGQRLALHRIAELAKMHGPELSSGVCTLVRSACRMASDAEYLSRRAAAEDNVELLRASATLDAGARQALRDAWLMAELEAKSRPRRSILDEIEAAADRMLLEAPAGDEGGKHA